MRYATAKQRRKRNEVYLCIRSWTCASPIELTRAHSHPLSLSQPSPHRAIVTCDKRIHNNTQQEDDEVAPPPLDEGDIALLKSYGLGPYHGKIKTLEEEIKSHQQTVKDLIGIKESDTGLSPPSMWDLVGDKQMMSEEAPLQVARCTKIIAGESGGDAEGASDGAAANSSNAAGNKYVINVKQIAKFVVGLGDKVAPTDIEEGMRVGVDRSKYAIQIPLPPKIDPTVSLMTVEDKPDVTYDDVGGAKDAMEKLREVLELPLLHPERFVTLGIDPPKGILLYGPPGTGKTLSARAVANRTDACFIRVIGSELVQKYVGEGARMVRELFTMARSKRACIVFFDEIDAIGGARGGSDDNGSDNEVQRTMLQIVTELDGFDARGNIKILMATNRPDTLDPALLRPGRLDRKVEFGLPDLEGRGHILKIHSKRMNCDRDIRFELIARLCPSTTGAELHSVCTEAGMYAIRARRKSVSEKDFLDSVNKVVKGYKKFSSTPKYMVYN
jgi:26S proteasome regulatory subunit T1